MKLENLDKKLKYLDKETDLRLTSESEPLTVKEVLATLCASGYDQPTRLEMARLYKLANTIYDAKTELEVDAEDITVINKAIEANVPKYGPYVRMQVLIESGLEKEEKK